MAKLTLSDLANLQNENTAVSTLAANNTLVEAAVENTLSRNGVSPNQMGADFDMNSNRILNLPGPISATEPLRLQDLSDFIGGGTISTLPSGGSTGAVLNKASATDYDAAWTNALINNTYNGLTITSTTGSLTISAGKTVSVSNTLTFTGTDASTAAFGAGGTVAYRADTLAVFAATTSAGLAGVISDETGSGLVVFNTSPTLVTPALGTPSAAVLTNATGLPVSTGIAGLATGVATFLGTPSSANLLAAVTDETGTGSLVFATSPTLTTPLLGTPTSGVLTNCTGLPISTGVSGLATGVAAFLATPSSANLITAVTNETGTGSLVFATSPTLVTPLLGTPTSGVLTNCTGLPLAGLATQAAYSIIGNFAGSAAVPTATALSSLTQKVTPAGTDLVLVQDQAASGALKYATVSSISTSSGVSSLAGNTGAFTLSGGITNSTNDIRVDGQLGYRNRLINPNGQIWQRQNTGASAITDGIYCVDRWYGLTQTAGVTASQVTNAENGTPYMTRLSQAAAAAQRFGIAQVIESANSIDLRGQAVVLSARVRMSATTTLRYAIIEWTGTADTVTKDFVFDWTNTTYLPGNFFTSTSTTITSSGSTALTANTLTSISLTGTIGSSANNVAVIFWTDSTQAQNVTLDVGKAQLEIGASATALAMRPFTTEMLLCRRFYQKSFAYTTAPAQNAGLTGSLDQVTATSAAGAISFRVYLIPVMLAAPTLTTYNTNAANADWWDTNASASRAVATAEVVAESFRIVMNAASTAGGQHFIHYQVVAEI